MTTANETPKAAKRDLEKGQRASQAEAGASGLLVTLALSAITSGLAGVALHRGFGVSVPFAAGFVLILAFAFFLRMVVLIVASGWQQVAVSSAPKLAAAVAIGTFVAETTLKEYLGAAQAADFEKHFAEAFPVKNEGGYL